MNAQSVREFLPTTENFVRLAETMRNSTYAGFVAAVTRQRTVSERCETILDLTTPTRVIQ